jgi:drug/metabolite transporter (DMT)-like permease
MNSRLKGLILGVIAAASYGTNPLFAVQLYQAGLSPDAVLFLRYLIAIPIMATLILMRRGSFRVTGKELLLLAIEGVLLGLSSVTLFFSYKFMDVGIASTILFVYPIMVAVIMALVFRERANRLTIVCIAMATIGILMLMRGSDGATVSLIGTALVFGSALSYAIYIVAINKTRLARVATLTITFYVLCFGMMVFLSRMIMNGDTVIPAMLGWKEWGSILGLAILPTCVSFGCTNGAIQRIGSTPTAILGAFEPVTAVVIGTFAFGEVITPRIFSGMLLVIVAVILVIIAPELSHFSWRKLIHRPSHR